MKATEMLEMVAARFSEQAGPMKRRQDAEAILRVLPSLDEHGARIYLERFLEKWDDSSASTEVAIVGFSRRRPMSELERRVYEQLAKGEPANKTRASSSSSSPSRRTMRHACC